MLDRLRHLSYIAAGAAVTACAGRPAPLVPVPTVLEPADPGTAIAWAAATLPRRHTAVQLRWRYGDERARYSGRGVIRIAPPDSLRFDFRGPLGYTGAAALVGDAVLWTEPRGEFGALVGGIPLLWAALGVVQPPSPEAQVYTLRAGRQTVWRFVVNAADTLDYVTTDSGPRLLEAEWRQGGTIRARSRTEYGDDGASASARIDFPEASARFELTVVARDTLAALAPALWSRR